MLICDEPVSALDVSVRAQVVNLLDDLQKELGLSYLFIAHDLQIVRHISDRVATMYLGRIVELGTYADVYDRTAQPYTRALMSAAPELRRHDGTDRERIILQGDPPSPIDPPAGCRFHTRCPMAQAICATTEPELIQGRRHARGPLPLRHRHPDQLKRHAGPPPPRAAGLPATVHRDIQFSIKEQFSWISK